MNDAAKEQPQQEQLTVRCRHCSRDNRVPSDEAATYRCWNCQAKIVVPQDARSGGLRGRLVFLAVLVFAAGGTAVVASFFAGIWEYDEVRAKVVSGWESTQNWLRERAREQSSEAPADEDLMLRTASIEWQVQTRTGESFQAKPLAEDVTLETEFGSLQIPIKDVISVVPGSETPVSLRRKIAVLIDRLGDSDTEVVRQTAEELVVIGPDAVAQLKQAEAERELEISRAATDLLSRIRSQYNQELDFAEGDLVVTRYFGVRGRLTEETILLTAESGDESIAWNQLRRADRAEWTATADKHAAKIPKPTGTVVIETDRGTWTGPLQNKGLRIQTPYGELEIPGERVTSIQRPADDSLRAAEQATLDLLRAEDDVSRLAALTRLGEAGSAGALTLQRVVECKEGQAGREAQTLLAQLAKQGDHLAPLPFRVRTVHGEVGGVIQDQALEIRTEWGDIERIDVAAVRSVTSVERAKP